MVDAELFKIAASQGVVGLLAFGMFKVYEKTTKEHAEKLEGHITNWKGQADILVKVVQDNTEAMTALRSLLEDHKR